MSDTITFPIPLDQAQVWLVAAVLQHAAEECHAVTPPEAPADQGAGITLGRLAAHWTDITEQELHCSVVNLHGERLYMVPLTLEGWYQVRAALSEHAAQLSRTPGGTPAIHENRRRARQALLLADRITEATSDR
ncbi:hypothetical protein A6A06_16590 [Streptomyces sp. CB02923]|uniref:hypothetical protein n=1 Tax=Streptomyces sp. CB02923 TaxID=1718985 RepID=UPI00093DBE7C|nr:hypothetical protein [Streptomyces sp. CB02923]OKI00593.1 hypothetical protein A6A06_16590 [Streptomyces sp. CB02923]